MIGVAAVFRFTYINHIQLSSMFYSLVLRAE